MNSKQDFVKFYFEHKDKNGCVLFDDILNNFFVSKGKRTPFVFVDANGVNYVKKIGSSGEMSAEVIMSRIYQKLGFDGAIYYPCKYKRLYDLAISQNLLDENSIFAHDFKGKIFENYGNIFPKKFKAENEPKLTGSFTPESIKQLLVMRLMDTASGNTDRHLGNFVYETTPESEGEVVCGIKPFDFGSSRGIDFNRHFGTYYNDFVQYGRETYNHGLRTSQMLKHFRDNQTVEMFLPQSEASEILGSVDVIKEAQEIKQETGFEVDERLVDLWAKNFDEMAEHLEQ